MRGIRTPGIVASRGNSTARLVVATLLSAASSGGGCGWHEHPAQLKSPGTSVNADEAVGGPWFADVSQSAGVAVTHRATGQAEYFFPSAMSTGAAWIDFDQDGNLDLFLAVGSYLPPGILATKQIDEQPTGDDPPSHQIPRMLRQQADHSFVDVTHDLGLAIPMYSHGVAVGDVNNDGFPDLYLTSYGGDRLLVNRGGQRFEDQTEAAGITNQRWSTSATLFDYDRDGWLDLFVCNYVDYDPTHLCLNAQGRPDFCNPMQFARTADILLRNRTGDSPAGQVRFEDRSVAAGIAAQMGAGLGVVCGDFNQDGWPDLYVANDGHANFLWMNQRNGSFREEGVLWGVAYDALGQGQGSMGVAADDLNADGYPDLFVTNLDGETNSLYLSVDGTGYVESAAATGLASASFPLTGFGTACLDIDRDGQLDVVVVNGRVRRAVTHGPSVTHDKSRTADPGQNRDFWDDYVESNLLYVGNADGRFRHRAHPDDDFLRARAVSRGLAAGDYDNDGDVDLVVTALGGPVRLYRNETQTAGHWLLIRAVDPRWGGRDALGAQLTVVSGSRRWLRWVNPGASYQSSHDPRVHFGLGDVSSVDRIEVLWPDGAREQFPVDNVDRLLTLARGAGAPP